MSEKHLKRVSTPMDDKLDEALKETFPASDPVSVEPVDGPVAPEPKHAPHH